MSMTKEGYISDFISQYVTCFMASAGFAPEISAADYIMLRRQALAEYMTQPELSDMTPHPDAGKNNLVHRPPMQQSVHEDTLPAPSETHPVQEPEDTSLDGTDTSDDELAILQALGDS